VKKLLKFVFVTAFVLGGWVLAAMSLHVVRAPGKQWGIVPLDSHIELIPKSNLGFGETWVDVTKWTRVDVSNHNALQNRFEQAGKSHLLQDALNTLPPVAVIPSKAAEADSTYTTSTTTTDAPKATAGGESKAKSIFDFSDQKKKDAQK
jgi:hypothetical protein